MPAPFTRQLGYQPGNQLNPVIDQSGGFPQDNRDQVFAIAMRAPRGRIDAPFSVDASNERTRLGINDPVRTSLLNEAYEQVHEALQTGAAAAIVYRLTTAAAAIKWVVFNAPVTPAPFVALTAIAQQAAGLYLAFADVTAMFVGQQVVGTNIPANETVAAVAGGNAVLTPTAPRAVAAGQSKIPASSTLNVQPGMLIRDTTTSGAIPANTVVQSVVSAGAPVAATTTAGTAATGTVIQVASTAGILPGMLAYDITAPGAIPAGTTVLSVTSTTVTLSAQITAPGVGSGDSFSFTPTITLSQNLAAGVVANDALSIHPTVRLALSTITPVAQGTSLTITSLPRATWTVSDTPPTSDYTFAFQHLECFNDGTTQSFHVETVLDSVTNQPVPATFGTLNVYDPITGEPILQVSGSLNSASIDEFGNSNYLVDVIAAQIPEGESPRFNFRIAAGATIPTDSPAYGTASDGSDNVSSSGLLVSFSEGGTGYLTSDYDRAVAALKYSDLNFGYIASGGSRAPALIQRLDKLGNDLNIHLRVDIPGELPPVSAVAWAQQLGLTSRYTVFLWAPINANIPMGGGKAVLGTGGIYIGYSCQRNGTTRNGEGFAKKNFPIAGKNYPIGRTGRKQIYTPSEQELSLLAKNQIIPVIYDRFNGGAEYVFSDVLTTVKSQTSLLKLVTVAEMSADLDQQIALYSKEILLLPMSEYISKMEAFLDVLLNGAVNARWLVPSRNLPNNAPFQYTVLRDANRPADLVHTRYWTSYDGVARQATITQTLVS